MLCTKAWFMFITKLSNNIFAVFRRPGIMDDITSKKCHKKPELIYLFLSVESKIAVIHARSKFQV